MTTYHVTSNRNGSAYGHATTDCDPAGCAGTERRLPFDADPGIVEECGCGEATGIACAGGGAPEEMATVEFVRREHRDSWRAAGGTWWGRGERIRCIALCAYNILEAEAEIEADADGAPEWARIVE